MTDAKRWQSDELAASRRVSFGAFEIDLKNRELFRRGARVKLQQKPFQILQRLLDTPGELVSRVELAQLLWPGLHVVFEGSLNTAVNALRRALRDPWRNPRYIETRPGIGYRLIAPVRTAEHQSGSPAAYQDYQKGRYFFNKSTEDDLRKSVAYFQSALTADPDYAPAYAGLADAYIGFAMLGLMPAMDAYQRSREFAETALRIDRRSPDAHLALAELAKLAEWDWAGAEAGYRRAIELNSNHARAHQLLASFLAVMGRRDQAALAIDRALELDPTSLAINAEAAWIRYLARDFEGAAERSWKTLAMDPRFAPAQNTLALAYQQMGMTEEAIVEFQNASTCSGDQPAARAALGHALAIAGKRDEAAEILQSLERLSSARLISSYWLGVVQLGLDQDAQAIESLQRAHRERDPWIIWLSVDPRFDRLGDVAGSMGQCRAIEGA